MLNTNKLALYIILSPVVLIVSCLVLVLPLNAIMQWKQMLQDDEGHFSLNMASMVSYIKMIPTSWLFIIASLCTYKAVTKYQLTFKKLCYNMQQAYLSLEFNFEPASSQTIPGSFQVDEITPAAIAATTTTTTTTNITTTHTITNTKKHHHKKSFRNKHSSPTPIPKTKVVVPPQMPSSDLASNADSDEWIVCEPKRAKRSSLPAMSKINIASLPAKRHNSCKTPPTFVVATAIATAVAPAVPAASAVPAVVPANEPTNLEKRSKLKIKELLPLRQAWTSPTEEDVEEDVPCLSDNDTDSQISSDSPRLSTQELPFVSQQPQFYSPFSTGFDFGVTCASVSNLAKDEAKFYPSHLDEYLASQAPCTKTPSVENISQYTPTTNNRALNILKLLNPSHDQIETTITPTAFKYFDEMLISNSLFTHQKQDDLFLKNKKEWNSFAR